LLKLTYKDLHFAKKLKKTLRETGSHLCIGLDSDLKKIPAFLKTAPNPILEFNNLIVDATNDLVCAYKLNIAFYERAQPMQSAVI
jgi:orotidine-5'-phosphate decarboxylase